LVANLQRGHIYERPWKEFPKPLGQYLDNPDSID